MMKQVAAIKCMHVVVQINLGYYDEENNLVNEETFPQNGGTPIAAKIFHPHSDQLDKLIEFCVEQAWEKLKTQGPAPVSG